MNVDAARYKEFSIQTFCRTGFKPVSHIKYKKKALCPFRSSRKPYLFSTCQLFNIKKGRLKTCPTIFNKVPITSVVLPLRLACLLGRLHQTTLTRLRTLYIFLSHSESNKSLQSEYKILLLASRYFLSNIP